MNAQGVGEIGRHDHPGGRAKIRHGENGGKATLLGSIITEAKK